LEKAQEHDLYFKAKKCEFRKLKIEYLGLVVEEEKLAIDPAKLKGILDWPVPKTVKEVQSVTTLILNEYRQSNKSSVSGSGSRF
jgi:hypothetical protein